MSRWRVVVVRVAGAMSLSELSGLLSQSDPARVLSSVDSLCRSLSGAPYLLSSSFYPSFGLLLHRLLSVSFQGSVPPLVCSVGRAWDVLRPSSGSLFAVVFSQSAFPPKYALPVSLLPPQCRDFLRSPAASSALSSAASVSPAASAQSSYSALPGCPGIVPLLRSSHQPSSDCLQLSIHDYFFFSLALFLTHDLPAAAKLLSSAHQQPYQAHHAATAASHGAHTQPFNADDCYRSYLSVVQQYLAFFLPSTVATAAAAGSAIGPSSGSGSGVGAVHRSLHGSSLVAILSEVWMGDAASRMSDLSLSFVHSGTSSRSGVSSTALPSPFVSSLSTPSSSPSSTSYSATSSSFPPPSSSSSVLSPASQSAAGSFSFPSLRVLGCVRLLVAHLLSAPSLSARVVSAPTSSAATVVAPSSVWCLSVSSVDVCLFRFLRSCLLHPPSQYDDRLLSVVSVWLSVLTSAMSSKSSSPSSVLPGSLAFFSVLLVDFLHSLLATDVGREGSVMRTASLKQCVQLLSLLQSSRAELERVEQLLMFGGADVARKGGSRSTRQPAAFLLRSGLGSSRASTQQKEAEAVRASFMRLAAQLPDEHYARVFTRAAQSQQPLSHAQQLVVQVVRYLTPASVRQGLAPLSIPHSASASTSASASAAVMSAGRSSAHLLQSSSAFTSQLIAEAQLFEQLTQLAVSTFDLPLDAIDDTQGLDSDLPPEAAEAVSRSNSVRGGSGSGGGGDTTADRYSAASVVRSLSPSRVGSDPYRRLSSSGRQQLARGVALCSKQASSLRFVGGEWDRPVASNECAAAVRWLHLLHAAATQPLASQQQHSQLLLRAAGRLLGQMPLRMLARWDVLVSGASAVLLLLCVVAAVLIAVVY